MIGLSSLLWILASCVVFITERLYVFKLIGTHTQLVFFYIILFFKVAESQYTV